MELKFKQRPESHSEKTLRLLQETYPDKKFKILSEFCIAVKTGWFSWQELDLKAMGLLPERPEIGL